MADGSGPFLQPGIPSRMIPCRGYAGAFAVLRAKASADCGLPDAQRSFQTLAPEPALSVHADNQPYIRHRILIPVVCVGTSAAGIFARFVCIAASGRLRDGCRGFVAGSLCFRVRVVVVSWPVCRVFKAGGRGGLERFCSRRSGCVPAGWSSERGRRFPPRVSCFGCLPCRRVRRQFCASIVRLRNNC